MSLIQIARQKQVAGYRIGFDQRSLVCFIAFSQSGGAGIGMDRYRLLRVFRSVLSAHNLNG